MLIIILNNNSLIIDTVLVHKLRCLRFTKYAEFCQSRRTFFRSGI